MCKTIKFTLLWKIQRRLREFPKSNEAIKALGDCNKLVCPTSKVYASFSQSSISR